MWLGFSQGQVQELILVRAVVQRQAVELEKCSRGEERFETEKGVWVFSER